MSIYKDIVEGYQLNNIQEKDKLNNVLVQLNEKDDQEMINRISLGILQHQHLLFQKITGVY